MPLRREKRLPSNSSRVEFVENKKDKSSCQRCFVRRGLIALGLSLAAITLIVVVIVVWFRPSSASDKSAENNDDAQCSFSKEARRVGLDLFLEKLRTEYHRYHPNRIASKPGVTSSEVRQVYQPYDFRPEAIKNATDASTRLYNELQTTVFADVHEQKLKLRERKAMYVAKNVLSVVSDGTLTKRIITAGTGCWVQISSVGNLHAMC
ncbi:hypothetical protein OS493_027716, partial [Desmophyllum pertusum]